MDKPLEIHEHSSNSQQMIERATWRDFIQLTKPGIIRSNVLATVSGFWLASKWNIDWLLLLITLIGTTLVLASSCVFNNYLDRDMDDKMERTQNRALPAGKIQPRTVLNFAIILGAAGLSVLYFGVNSLAVLLALVGMFFYVIVYTLWLKRTSTWSTSVGGVSGAVPPVIGYVAVSGQLDMGAVLLFILLFLWQPPHFWALGIRRKEEYRAAGFPLLPVVKGVRRTQWQIIPYIVLLVPVTVGLYVYGYTGLIFLVVTMLLNVIWMYFAISGLLSKDVDGWSRKMFIFSINYLIIVFVVMILNTPAS